MVLAPQDILHIPGLGFDGLVGYPPIAMAKNAIGLEDMDLIPEEAGGNKYMVNGNMVPLSEVGAAYRRNGSVPKEGDGTNKKKVQGGQ